MSDLILHLGVVDIPYVNEDEHTAEPIRKPKRGGKSKGSMWRRSDLIGGDAITTTGQVAELLEEKYHIMEHFWQRHQKAVVDAIGDALAGSLETVAMGGPPAENPFAAGEEEVKALFKHFLTNREMDDLGYPGIPTIASGAVPSKRKGGINHRLAHPYAQSNPVRPSFVDTGTYESSFAAWMEVKG